tara:strand:+ start:7539 stop:8825 length:1287 start_codon:yes stop_codon:yes gene_type:complete
MKTNKIKIKNLLLITIFMLSILTAISLSSAAIYNQEHVVVTLVNQQPDPVKPGGTVDVRIKIENQGQNAKDFEFEFVPKYPFSLYDEEDTTKYIGILGAGDDYAVYYKYKVRIDENAVEGINEIEFKYKHSNVDSVTKKFDINIQTEDAIVLIKEVKTEPETISQGQEAKINFKLENIADSLIRDISINLDLSSSDMPISPLSTGSEKKIKTIKPGEEAEMSFDIITLATAESQIHKLPLTLTYSDEIGKNYSKTDIVSIIISSHPDLTYNVDSTDILFAGQPGTATLKIVNKGTEDIKFLNIMLKDSDDFVKLSNDDIYVGNIDSDDYETADFDLYIEKKVKNLELPLTVEYRDSINREYKEEIKVPITLYKAGDAKKYNLISGNGTAGWIVMILIVGVGFYFYRRYKKRKKNKNHKHHQKSEKKEK